MGLDSRTEEQPGLVADPCNRTVLTILDDATRSLHVEELAERLVTRDTTVVSSSEYDDRVERALLTLHHSHLPRLADAGLVEYDRETNLVTRRPSSTVEVDWQDETTIDELVAYLRIGDEADEPDEDAIGVIEGRESVIECGRQLADEAEEELFCMYVSTDLLEDECLRRAGDAIDRGVEMSLGSHNSDVRDLTCKHLPDATLWEPQLDWMNAPRNYPRVGRLVLVDRRTVMLALLDGPVPDGANLEERAVIGDGEDNPLVVLVRELLGSRLDHLDHQSTDFRSELPS